MSEFRTSKFRTMYAKFRTERNLFLSQKTKKCLFEIGTSKNGTLLSRLQTSHSPDSVWEWDKCLFKNGPSSVFECSLQLYLFTNSEVVSCNLEC